MADRLGPKALAAVIAIALGTLGTLTMLPSLSEASASEVYGSSVAIWLNALVVGYVWGILRYGYDALRRDLAVMAPFVRGAVREPTRLTKRSTFILVVIGVAMGIALTGDLAPRIVRSEASWLYAWTLIILPVLWPSALLAITAMLMNSVALYRLGRSGLEIDPRNRARLAPLVRIGVRHLAFTLVGLAVIPVQSILTGPLDYWDFVPAVVVTVPAALGMLLAPLVGAHLGIASAKRQELARIEAMDAGSTEQDAMLRFLYRREIERLPEWPVSVSGLMQVAFYFVIPPLAWTAAALVENLLSGLLD